jgi:flagellar export protein FliJ
VSVSRADVKRLDRIAGIRETVAGAAEARLREAELQVQQIESQAAAIDRQIHLIRAEITQTSGLSGHEIQQNEKFILRLNKQRAVVVQALESAKKIAAERQREWMEARREQRIIERLQDKRLLEWQRHQEIARQKAADDNYIGKIVREKHSE